MNVSQEQKERQRQAMKFFDYAENPVKEWIAEYLNKTVEEVFDLYQNESDVISIESNKKHYLVYLSSTPNEFTYHTKKVLDRVATENKIKAFKEENKDTPDLKMDHKDFMVYKEVQSKTAFVIPDQIVKSDTNEYFKLYQASSMMHDAVYNVYPFVVKTIFKKDKTVPVNVSDAVDETAESDKNTNPFDDVTPIYDPTDRCFEFKMINRYHYLKEQANHQILECTNQLTRINEGIRNPQFNPENLPKIEENKQKLFKIRDTNIETFNKITQDMIDERQKVCDEVNDRFATLNKLYIVLECNTVQDEEQKMKRLPVIGEKFTSPDDESVIDKFKKEMNIRE
jgi:hypothetical protein